jgi:hypothetical protein
MYPPLVVILGDKNNARYLGQCDLAEWLKSHGIAGWLETATDGLADSAKERVTREIGTHYAEAVSVHMEAGFSENAAKESALAELGNPEKAARNLKKIHLTQSEAKLLRWGEEMASKPLTSFNLFLVAILVPGAMLALRPQGLACYICCAGVGTYAILRLAGYYHYKQVLQSNSFLRIQSLFSHLDFIMCIPLWVLLYVQTDHLPYAIIWIIFACYGSNRLFRIWNKLRKIKGEWGGPPSQATSS